jgi:hypothetical protein
MEWGQRRSLWGTLRSAVIFHTTYNVWKGGTRHEVLPCSNAFLQTRVDGISLLPPFALEEGRGEGEACPFERESVSVLFPLTIVQGLISNVFPAWHAIDRRDSRPVRE